MEAGTRLVIRSNSTDMDIIICAEPHFEIPINAVNLIAHGARIGLSQFESQPLAGMKEIQIPVKSRIPMVKFRDSLTYVFIY